ncbi:hypothetical protein [Vibrio hangzhouensis]|uniref:hypothetical protein n=1 Tax=Vibrio hangzhouensis TaxID=462991 RepID=UPI001C9816A2|nr:hypothetical protein [Vibrio hangzhouensis]MBY6196655.1 hypothetical protein [Vibrio hangzhouensis]
MRGLLGFVVISNLLAGLTVFVLGQFIPFFSTVYLSDFCFFIAMVLWGIAALSWDGGRGSRTYDVDIVTHKTKTMVKGHSFETDKRQQYRQNYTFAFSLFLAGLIPLMLSALSYWFL